MICHVAKIVPGRPIPTPTPILILSEAESPGDPEGALDGVVPVVPEGSVADVVRGTVVVCVLLVWAVGLDGER
jgi:hypothetical protein